MSARVLTNEFRLELLNVIFETNKRVRNINYGGCGLFAKELGRVLISLGFDVKYSLIFKLNWGTEIGNECINNNDIHNLYKTGWTHIMLLINDKYYIDSDGIKTWIEKPSLILPNEMFKAFISSKYRYRWNTIFDRKDVPKIRKTVKTLL